MVYPVSVTCNTGLVLKSDRNGIERYRVDFSPLSPLRSVFPVSRSRPLATEASREDLFVGAGKARERYAIDRPEKKDDRWALSTGR